MSYDLSFLRRKPGESWEAALDRLEEPDPAPDIAPELRAAWVRIVTAVREILGPVELFEGDRSMELSDDVTGVQVSCYPGELSLTVPYWHTGEQAEAVMRAVYAIAAVIQRETGFEGYDPQLDCSVSQAAPDAAREIYDNTSAYFKRPRS